ncbi:putative pyridoxal-dependent decarboxylase domain-containing protein 2 [Copidosoma floridanum]|uniref:putative pyridoxal-dependent decarboxylase domain-containing protein 2 n=1 Tax=Copidosoma floridanum TaxID=29053 RepID=UPI0006C9E26D|nr:putative pyridoxal-dependent decarboxylase domain-containing protein 2 [Copidosoma floridanum]
MADEATAGAGSPTSAMAKTMKSQQTVVPNNVPESPVESELSILKMQAYQTLERLEESGEKGTESEGATWNNPLGFLLHAKAPEEIFTLIQDLVVYEEAPAQVKDGKSPTEQNQITSLPPLTDAAKLALISHSVSAYAMSLPRSHSRKLASRLTVDTTRWLSHIFRFVDCASAFHEDPLEGLVRVTRLALHKKYPRYMDEGYAALANSPPLIYSSVAPLGLVQHLCKQLLLPLHCIRPIPQNTLFGSRHTMDIAALERRLTEDSQSNSVTPLLVLAEAGSELTGHCDNITRLQEICDKYNVWLHLRGNSLAALALSNSSKDLTSKLADSITLSLGVWLGIPSLPVVTLYRLTDTRGGHSTASLIAETLSGRLPTLPLWTALQALGRDSIVNRFKHCFLVVEELYNKLKKFNCIRLLSQEPGGDGGVYSLKEILTNNTLGTAQLLEVVSSALVFQFVPSKDEDQSQQQQQEQQRVPAYYDKLNSWLGQILQRDIQNVEIEFCKIEQYGVAIRICPLESPEYPPCSDDIDSVVACLEQQIDILLATVHHKETFTKLVSENESLRLVEIPEWAGLGGVRYSPPWTWDLAKNELNNLNGQLVETLRHTDIAFSLGTDDEGLAFVRFGMVTHETDVEDLLSLVLKVGQDLEASSKLMDTMSEVVKRGIEAAQTDLERENAENAEKLLQEGMVKILRHVPVVGTFVNWWNPPPKESGVRGRSLNLQAGVVESTENIYKYHMQLQPNSTTSNGSGGARTPPQPMIQTPVSQSHSRSSSHSSQQSGKTSLQNIITTVTVPSPPVNKDKTIE